MTDPIPNVLFEPEKISKACQWFICETCDVPTCECGCHTRKVPIPEPSEFYGGKIGPMADNEREKL